MMKLTTTPDPEGIYTVEETCQILDISPKTLRRYSKNGDLPRYKRKADGLFVYYGRDILACYYKTSRDDQ